MSEGPGVSVKRKGTTSQWIWGIWSLDSGSGWRKTRNVGKIEEEEDRHEGKRATFWLV